MSEQLSTADSAHRAAIPLSSASTNGQARAVALAADLMSHHRTTSLISYQSAGELLIIGDAVESMALAKKLPSHVRATVLIDRRVSSKKPFLSRESIDGITVIIGQLTELSGALGQFTASVKSAEGEVNLATYALRSRETFDLVLDLSKPARINREIAPFGYYPTQNDPQALERALVEIPDMVGEFEKPKYFEYNPDICAHGASGLAGCRRCLDACPTQAIQSLGEKVFVDPFLCQGGGSCASACPSGAIRYVYPPLGDLLSAVKAALKIYLQAGGAHPIVLFHDGGIGHQALEKISSTLPEHVLPFEIEEVGSVGMDAWLGSIAFGASAVWLLTTSATPASVRRELEEQLQVAQAILTGMGYARERVRLLDAHKEKTLQKIFKASPEPSVKSATFATLDEKRTTIRMAVDHLYAESGSHKRYADLPRHAAFGQITVDRKGCTLCLSCVSVCPASALTDGGDIPQLNFTEWNCVQCGLCETACPEHVITRETRFSFDANATRTTRTLNEDKVVYCVGCGKPFATERLVNRMSEKLAGHWMFQSEEMKARLHMCENCRVSDMFRRSGGLMDPHQKP